MGIAGMALCKNREAKNSCVIEDESIGRDFRDGFVNK